MSRCTIDKFNSIKNALKQVDIELDKLKMKRDTANNVGNNLKKINEKIDFMCLLEFNHPSAMYIYSQLQPAAAQASIRGASSTALKLIPHVKDLLEYLQKIKPNGSDKTDGTDKKTEQEPKNNSKKTRSKSKSNSKKTRSKSPGSNSKNNTRKTRSKSPSSIPKVPTLFPKHKYLDMSDVSELNRVKRLYRKLSLLLHTDRPITATKQKEEFQILSNEYQTILNKFSG
jgi:curved DNA-binding protein CbpA